MLVRNFGKLLEEKVKIKKLLLIEITILFCFLFIYAESGQKQLMVAGSIGPYGACQADMSEYTGTYADSMSEDDFIKWHRPRLLALLQAGVDYLAFETFPALKEAVAVLKLVRQEAPNVPAWISFSCKVGNVT